MGAFSQIWGSWVVWSWWPVVQVLEMFCGVKLALDVGMSPDFGDMGLKMGGMVWLIEFSASIPYLTLGVGG